VIVFDGTGEMEYNGHGVAKHHAPPWQALLRT
jgi:hypothetical protein